MEALLVVAAFGPRTASKGLIQVGVVVPKGAIIGVEKGRPTELLFPKPVRLMSPISRPIPTLSAF